MDDLHGTLEELKLDFWQVRDYVERFRAHGLVTATAVRQQGEPMPLEYAGIPRMQDPAGV